MQNMERAIESMQSASTSVTGKRRRQGDLDSEQPTAKSPRIADDRAVLPQVEHYHVHV